MQFMKKTRLRKSVAALGLAISMFAGLSATAFASTGETATVKSGVNFRGGPSTSAPIRGFIRKGAVLPVESANKWWVQVDYNGKKGYVSRGFVTLNENASTSPARTQVTSLGSKIVHTAESFKGKVTYVWGARNPQKLIFDCSSFTQYVFQLNGVHIPWGAGKQTAVGTYVARNHLQPGDLVMFSVGTPGKIGHVGIYIGNGQFINNLPHVGVVISNFNSPYWTSHYITARHIQ